MNVFLSFRRNLRALVVSCALLSLSSAICAAATGSAWPTGAPAEHAASSSPCQPARLGSPYLPVDSWVYPAVLRLYSLGFVDRIFIGMRPWTRLSIARMLSDSADRIQSAPAGRAADEAAQIYKAVRLEIGDLCASEGPNVRFESIYSDFRGISGAPLGDSFHLGSTIINDYGRPYEHGFSGYTGLSGHAVAGRFTLYARGELQCASSGTGYSQSLAETLAHNDGMYFYDPVAERVTYYDQQATIPGPRDAGCRGRFIEAYGSAHVLSHEISFGKVDQWLGPAYGGSFAYSNNAENIYAFEVNRVEPLRIPVLSRLTGPFRYEFMVGRLNGHLYIPNPLYTPGSSTQPNVINPGNPGFHLEKISFEPTGNLEFGFSRSVIWGGEGHAPINLHSFLKSFFSTSSPSVAVKYSRDDPGARFATFDFTYRLPFVRNWLTLYSDSEVHDDVSPIDAPRRAAWRPGLYLSHVPSLAPLDARIEAVWTDPPITSSLHGMFMYWESVQRQGYTNNGQIFGDWIGREAKGGQTWLTWHLSGNEWVEINARHQKIAKDFLRSGTTEYGSTINDLGFQVVKRIRRQTEVDGSFTFERYNEPLLVPREQTVKTTKIRLTWYPGR